VIALLPSLAAAEARYPDRLWGADLLLLLEAGPGLLDPNLPLDVPPPPGHEETRSELDRMLLLSARLRDPETRARIALEADADPRALLLSAGLIPDRFEAPALWGLLELALKEATYFTLREKRRFSRLRPSMIALELGTTIPNPPHPAYPSGHAAQMYALAGTLSRVRPGCAEAYRLFAAGVALRREIAGVHFPSDTRAGERLAASLLPRLLSLPEPSDLLARARREVISRGVPAACSPEEGLR
jgi:acid phosphatase (class A)